MIRWFRTHGKLLFWVCAVTAVGVSLTSLVLVHDRSMNLRQQAERAALVSTGSFTQLASEWLKSGLDRQHDRLLGAIEFMLSHGHMYVAVVSDGNRVLAKSSPSWNDSLPAILSQEALVAVSSYRNVLGQAHIAVTYPIAAIEGAGSYVQIGLRDQRLEGALQTARWLGASGGLIAWILCTATGIAAYEAFHRRRARSDVPGPLALNEDTDVLQCGPVRIHRGRKTVTMGASEHAYPPKLFHLLELLALEQDRALSADEILKHVWTDAHYASANDVRQCVYRLRRRLDELDQGLGDCVSNIKGFGYRLDISKYTPSRVHSAMANSPID